MMDLQTYLADILSNVAARCENGTAYEQQAYFDIVTEHMAEHGITSQPESCHFEGKIGRSKYNMCGYSLSEHGDRLDVFVDCFRGDPVLQTIELAELRKQANQCVELLALCVSGAAAEQIDPSQDFHAFASRIRPIFSGLEQARIIVLTDAVSKEKHFEPRHIEIAPGKNLCVKLEVFDIERLHRHVFEGAPRDEIVANFDDLCGGPLSCALLPETSGNYEAVLAWIPGEAIRQLYDAHGDRLLESNVRSFLSIKAKGVNKGMQNTLLGSPSDFAAFNNGLVILATSMAFKPMPNGAPGLAGLQGLQIVNGGQTSASIYFTKAKSKTADLSPVWLQAKIIVPKDSTPAGSHEFSSKVSRFANSQNVVTQADLSANNPFHVELEKLSASVFQPNGTGLWFYERATGSYSTKLMRTGTTPALLKKLKKSLDPKRKITKTELAKTLCSWNQLPDQASLGAQKNFSKFMLDNAGAPLPTVEDFKAMVAKTILFRETLKIVRTFSKSFQANVANYTMSVLAAKLGPTIKLQKIWDRQCVGANNGLSPQLLAQILIWAKEVDAHLRTDAGQAMISERAKKSECKTKILAAQYSAAMADIPETI